MRLAWAVGVAAAALACTAAPSRPREPVVPPVAVRDSTLPSIFIAGNSTAARGAGERQQGWGVPFAGYFDSTKVNVVNRARGGRSSRTFVAEGLWARLMADVKRGDIVLIEFGHNDGGAVNDSARARGSLPGIGDDSVTIVNRVTKQREVVHSFGWYVRRMIADARARGATPIVLSLSARNIWQGGRIERGSGRFGAWAAEVARRERVQFLDLTNTVADSLEKMGQARTAALYRQDHTHFDSAGADLHARLVVSLLRGLRPSPVPATALSAKGVAVAPDRWVWLNLPVPADRSRPTLFLIGNSTVRNGRGDGAGGQWGWGDFIAPHFDTSRINLVNRAVGGLSARTYLTQGHWDRVMTMLRPGDVVMMEFGHNDAGPLNDTSRARGVLPGIGDETREIDNLLTKQREVVHTFGWYLRKFVADTRAKGARPIVNSLTPRKLWQDGTIVRVQNSFASWAELVARAERAPFVHVNELVARRMEAMPPARVDSLYADANLHSSASGAALNAAAVAEGLASLPDNPLRQYLRRP